MHNDEIPNVLKNRLDMKSFTVEMFNIMIELLKSGKIESVTVTGNVSYVILTTIGLIEGEIVDMSESEPSTIDDEFFIKQVFKGRNSRISELESKESNLQIVNNSSAVVLKNVVIRPYADVKSTIKLNSLILFADQILGISLGSFKNL